MTTLIDLLWLIPLCAIGLVSVAWDALTATQAATDRIEDGGEA
jgi:hypothetical protein